jgi:hypothetical protein
MESENGKWVKRRNPEAGENNPESQTCCRAYELVSIKRHVARKTRPQVEMVPLKH